jgi:hypothetical protein
MVPFGLNVGTNLDPTKFPNLPVDPKDIVAQANDLAAKQAAMITGGSVEKAARDKAFQLLASSLDLDANIVEVVAGNDLELLLSTGYLPVSTNRACSPLDPTAIASLSNNGTGSVLLRLMPVTNAKSYQVQLSTDAGKTWTEAGIYTQARRVVLNALTPATTYQVRARAIGGSTGASDWTGGSSILST